MTSAPSQGTTYLSNLDQNRQGFAIGLINQAFVTGPASGGYVLDSVTLQMGHRLGTPSGFMVVIRSDVNGTPGSELEVLAGDPNPTTAGNYLYGSAGLLMTPSTAYWIGISRIPNPSDPLTGYPWSYTTSSGFLAHDDWLIVIQPSTKQFAVSARPIPVPEPTASCFALLALLGFFRHKWQRAAGLTRPGFLRA